MLKRSIYQKYAHIKLFANIAGAEDQSIAVLKIPENRVYKMLLNTSLILKLHTVKGREIRGESTIYIVWKPAVGEDRFQVCKKFSYEIFRVTSIEEQMNNTDDQRLIKFTDTEIARAEKGNKSIITGLPAEHKVCLVLTSPDAVDWEHPNSRFQFKMVVMAEEEAEKEQAKAGNLI